VKVNKLPLNIALNAQEEMADHYIPSFSNCRNIELHRSTGSYDTCIMIVQ